MAFLIDAIVELDKTFGPALGEATVVLPDKNALAAFEQAASRYAARQQAPILLPKVVTLQRFCQDLLPISIAPKLQLLLVLQEALEAVLTAKSSFEQNRHLLELLLTDFEEIEAQEVDATLLFRSLVEETEILQLFADFVTPEEEAIIKQYWSGYKNEDRINSGADRLALFAALPQVYAEFVARLAAQRTTFRGSFYRQLSQKLASDASPAIGTKVAFVGFNKVSKSQEAIMAAFVQHGAACIVIDALAPETNTEEATRFQKRWGSARRFAKNLISTRASDARPAFAVLKGGGPLPGQQACRAWVLEQLAQKPRQSVAVVVAEETEAASIVALLAEAGMKASNLQAQGMAQSPVFSLLEGIHKLRLRLISAPGRTRIPKPWLKPLQQHPLWHLLAANTLPDTLLYARADLQSTPVLALAASVQSSTTQFWHKALLEIYAKARLDDQPAVIEQIQVALAKYNQLTELLAERCPEDPRLFWSVFSSELRGCRLYSENNTQTSVVCGTLADLQTQDFGAIYFLNANEGALPATLPRYGLIPLAFRGLMGMTTPKDDAAQQAYLFFRMCQRATACCFYVSESSDEMSQSEPSRFLAQLETYWQAKAEHTLCMVPAEAHPPKPIRIEKTEAVLELLKRFLICEHGSAAKPLYPTALTTYLECPLKFFLSKVMQLSELEVLTEDVDGSRFGNLVHNSMEVLFGNFKGKLVSAKDIEKLSECRREAVAGRMMAEYHCSSTDDIDELSFAPVVQEVVEDVVERLLARDTTRTPFVLLKLEDKLAKTFELPVELAAKTIRVQLNGKFDRADRLPNGSIEIVDYKTGSKVETSFKSWEELFGHADRNKWKLKEAFQIILYAWLLHKAEAEPAVKPTVIRIGDLYGNKLAGLSVESFTVNKVLIENVAAHSTEIEHNLKLLVKEIFDPAIPFTQTANHNACKYCSFAGLCHRN